MLRPMILLAIGIAVLDKHTRLARLETGASFFHAAISTTLGWVAVAFREEVRT